MSPFFHTPSPAPSPFLARCRVRSPWQLVCCVMVSLGRRGQHPWAGQLGEKGIVLPRRAVDHLQPTQCLGLYAISVSGDTFLGTTCVTETHLKKIIKKRPFISAA